MKPNNDLGDAPVARENSDAEDANLLKRLAEMEEECYGDERSARRIRAIAGKLTRYNVLQSALEKAEAQVASLREALEELRPKAEAYDRINTPEIDDFLSAHRMSKMDWPGFGHWPGIATAATTKGLLEIARKYRAGYIYQRHDLVKFTQEEADMIVRDLVSLDPPFQPTEGR